MKRITRISTGWSLITMLAVTLVFAVASPTAAFYLPDTGQTKCYQAVDPYAEIPCGGTGQDGAYNINPLSYTDNGDGTVTDNNTGLMWQQEDDDTTHNWYRASGTYHASYNPSSISVCGSAMTGNYTDWRLPTKKELISLVDYAIPPPGPTIRPVFTNTKSSIYWSSTTYTRDPDFAWSVEFYSGNVYTGYKNPDSYVLCVRGAQTTPPALVDNGDGTVTDSRTGLVWQQAEPGIMTWGGALSYCRDLQLAGESDWRLPNVKELESLIDDTRWDPAIDTTIFSGALSSSYWSSTTNAYYPFLAWYVEFYTGDVYAYGYGKDYNYNVRCVRGGDSLPAWRDGEADLGGGWKWLNWFGYYSTASEPWIYHQEHQWLYPYDDGSGGVFFWYEDLQEFVWTDPTTYPYLYRFGGSPAWLWYLKDSANPRWFYNYSTAGWEQLP